MSQYDTSVITVEREKQEKKKKRREREKEEDLQHNSLRENMQHRTTN